MVLISGEEREDEHLAIAPFSAEPVSVDLDRERMFCSAPVDSFKSAIPSGAWGRRLVLRLSVGTSGGDC